VLARQALASAASDTATRPAPIGRWPQPADDAALAPPNEAPVPPPIRLSKESVMNRKPSPARIVPLVVAIVAAFALAACQRQPAEPTVGQQVDKAIAKVESAGDQAKQAATEVARDVSAGAKDAAITTKINMALAADDKLSAIRIDVDTQGGKVTLTGKAPDATSRDHATTLAQAVEGVTSVDNRLSVN
jgi:hyperosmotically inducible periplasmic protein